MEDKLSTTGAKRSRGRPKGSGYRLDDRALALLADKRAKGEVMSVRASIVLVGMEDNDANVRRVQRRYKQECEQLLGCARQRQLAATAINLPTVQSTTQDFAALFSQIAEACRPLSEMLRRHAQAMEAASAPLRAFQAAMAANNQGVSSVFRKFAEDHERIALAVRLPAFELMLKDELRWRAALKLPTAL